MVKRRGVMNLFKRTSGLDAYAFGHALGILGVIMVLFYAVLAWFGGYSGYAFIEKFPIGFLFDDWTLFVGLVQAYVMGYVLGWIFVRVYNRRI